MRYEDIVASGGQALLACAGLNGPADASLRERDAGVAYAGIDVGDLGQRLLDAPGSWRRWYADGDVAGLARRMADQGKP